MLNFIKHGWVFAAVVAILSGLPGAVLAGDPGVEATRPFCEVPLADFFEAPAISALEAAAAEAAVDRARIQRLVDDLLDPLIVMPGMSTPALATAAMDFLALKGLSPWEGIVFWESAVSKIRALSSQWQASRGAGPGSQGEVFFKGSYGYLLVIATGGRHAGHIYNGLLSRDQWARLWDKAPLIPYGSLACRTCFKRRAITP